MTQVLGKVIADFTTQLSSALAIGATTATLQSATDDDGVALPSGRYFFTIDGGNSSKEHISCDLSGTSLSNIKSVSRQGVETTGVARAHRLGATVSITDFASLKKILDLLMAVTSFDSTANLGYDGAPTGLTGNQFATVQYVLDTVSGGTVTFDQQIIPNQTSGEALTINDVVYFKESDQRWYKADADLTATFVGLQLGINKTTASGAAITIQVAKSGTVVGFTGLTAGSKYYLSNTAGAISTSAGTNTVFIGWALTTTTFLLAADYNGVTLLPAAGEKAALVGGSNFGTPSASNKYITEDYLTAGLPVMRVYTSSGTWTKPAGLKYITVEVVGGGGGGGGSTTAQVGASGGGGGGYSKEVIAAASLAATEDYVVGAAGAAGAGTPTAGSAGGTSSFGTTPFLQATGGSGGAAASGAPAGGAGGVGSNGTLNTKGGGGSAGDVTTNGFSGAGGSSVLGGGGKAVAPNTTGADGGDYGGGGSGGNSTGSDTSGGAGAAGVVIVTEHFA